MVHYPLGQGVCRKLGTPSVEEACLSGLKHLNLSAEPTRSAETCTEEVLPDPRTPKEWEPTRSR